MLFLFFFLLGISIGSFLNVLIDRIPREESVLKGRSSCENCKKVLNWYDLIPLLSFIFLKGKCRYCNVRLSFFYPIVELITGVLFVFTAWFMSFNTFEIGSIGNYLILAFILSSFIVIFFTDLKYGIIPDKILYPAVLISFLTLFTSEEFISRQGFEWLQSKVFINHLFSAIAALIFFLLIFLITKGKGMGFGDVKLAFLIGLFLGFPKIITALYLAFLTGAVVSIILVLLRKKKLKGAVPFGPFLVLGSIVAFFSGDYFLKLFFKGI